MEDITTDVTVVGGGVIGLSIAYRLAKRGRKVTVLDDNRPGQASCAAAGMLAPLAESNSLPDLVNLGVPSLRSYPAFVEELSSVSGVPLALLGPGILRVATEVEEAKQLCAALDRQAATGFPVQLLTRHELLALEPALGDDVLLGILSPAEKHVPPLELRLALAAACACLDVRLLAHTPGLTLNKLKNGWSVTTPSRTVTSDILVVAAGVWARDLVRPLGVDLPVTPLKGQILTVHFQQPPAEGSARMQPFEHTIYAHATYLVPRPGGDIILGATEEPEAGFDPNSTDDAILALRARGARLLPSLAGAHLARATAGLRPASPDRLPMIGRLPGYDDAFVAAGHGRNGILLTPITAEFVHNLIVDGAPPPSTVNPERFATAI